MPQLGLCPRFVRQGSRPLKRLGLVTAAALCATLANGAHAQRQGAAGLSRIVNPDMLGVQVAYLESITGPARRVHQAFRAQGQDREYRIGGCEVTALVRGGEVAAYRVPLSRTCTFDLRRFPNVQTPVPVHQATFGMIADQFSASRFLPACLSGCGNAADPTFGLYGEGSRAQSSIEIVVSATYNNEQVGRAAEALRQSASRLVSDDDITMGRFSCHPQYDRLAQRHFQGVRIHEITIGYRLSPEVPDCR